jgi:hypothetical protein
VASDPGGFPIRDPVVVSVSSAEPFAEPDGYTIETAIEEVLVDAGLLADERQVEGESYEVRPEIVAGYVVSVERSNV